MFHFSIPVVPLHHLETQTSVFALYVSHAGAQAIGPFSPLVASSPKDTRTAQSKAIGMASAGTAMSPTSPQALVPQSPTLSDAGSIMSMPDEMVWYRNQPYVAPEKLQIVKPLEGSMTLLKWKLLASPQLGGATTFFSDAKRPGVHLKRTSLTEKPPSSIGQHLTTDSKIKSLSVNDLSVLSTNSPSTGRRRRNQSRHREHTKTSPLTLSISSTDKATGMNDISGLLPSPSEEGEDEQEMNNHSLSKIARDTGEISVSRGSASSEAGPNSSSFLSQVGSLFGSGWSRLSFNRNKPQPSSGMDHQDHGQVLASASTDVGLAGLL